MGEVYCLIYKFMNRANQGRIPICIGGGTPKIKAAYIAPTL